MGNLRMAQKAKPRKSSAADDPRRSQALTNYEAGLRALQQHNFEAAKPLFEKVLASGDKELRERAAIHLRSCEHNLDRSTTRLSKIATARIPFTLRIGAAERSALENLSKIEGRPINQLLNEAIKSYLSKRGQKERSLESNLASLRAYRKQDPGFERAIAAFVEAEASIEDPLEGKPVERPVGEGTLKPAGPVQSRVREVLGA